VKVVEEPVTSLAFGDTEVAVTTSDATLHPFDAIYVALGLRARSSLAVQLGAEHDEDGALLVDRHQQTNVPGLYGAGDVVQGLAQISVAMGHAAIAATSVHNQLPFRWATPEGGLEANEGTVSADPG
jgi:thioredoxin reductase (NADPH)